MAENQNTSDAKTEKELEKERADQNNKKNIQNAADVAMASKNPYAMAAGAVVKGADKVTGGKASELIGKAVTRANKLNPLGRVSQNASNKMAESGLSDLAGKGARAYNKFNNHGNDAESGVENGGGEQSLPSSDDEKVKDAAQEADEKLNNIENNSKKNSDSDDLDDNGDDNKKNSPLNVIANILKKQTIFLLLPFAFGFLLFFFVMFVILSVQISESNFDDALGAATQAGEEVDGVDYSAVSDEQREFLERLNDVRLSYQAQGKTFNPVLVVGVIQTLKVHGADLDYDDWDRYNIEFIVIRMFNNNVYDEEMFKTRLIQSIFPRYLSDATQKEYENMAQEVIDYLDNYNSFVGKEDKNSSCFGSSDGTCSYDIIGYYIRGKGNVRENAQVSDLYVRLMQCGTANGHNYGGTFGQPLGGEELVPFEKYILGVAYQEIGPSSPAEAIKAQMVAARSYILARHADMGGWRTLKQENGKWILQAASCTQDQVYCDPDKGCSSNDGQWGQIHSGQNHNSGFVRGPLPESSPLRSYAKETSGEVLVNSEGYIIYTGYTSTEQNQFIALANQGKDYKQILLQVYNQGSRASGASKVKKANCGNTSAGCGQVSSGEYVNWMQNEGPWTGVPMGNSGYTIKQIGCLVTSVAILIAKSGVETVIPDFNPGTFVQFLNTHGGFAGGGNFMWGAATQAAPRFHYQGQIRVLGMSREQKLDILRGLVSQKDVYVVAEVKGNTGQHWVAIDTINGDNIVMMDPGLHQTDMWATHPWYNTSTFAYYKVS